MVKRNILKIVSLLLIILLLLTTSVSAKSNHFKAFASQDILNDAGALGTETINSMVNIMGTLEYNNYYGSGYHTTSQRQDVLNYIGMTGNNYGLAVLAHGNHGYFTMGDGAIDADDISGTWHLVLINSCYTYSNNNLANAFKTVGYTHRASVGFTGNLYFTAARDFWNTFNGLAGSTNLSAIVSASNAASGAPGILYGDGSWNGYAWY